MARLTRPKSAARLVVCFMAVFAFMTVAAGCNATAARSQLSDYVARQVATAQAQLPPKSPANTLLVQGTDGNLYLVSPDGERRFALTTDASARRVYAQPAWSPSGEQIAWTGVDGAERYLITSSFDATDRQDLPVPFLPFYINWSPQGDQLAYLSNWLELDEPTMALRLVDVAEEGNSVQTLAAGQPFYFSWAPDGEELVTHIGNERVELRSRAGVTKSLAFTGGFFPAPQWVPDSDRLVFAKTDSGVQRLVITDLDGKELTELTDFADRISFSVSPDGRQLAYVVTERNAPSSHLGPLYVVDTQTRQTREIADRPVLAFFWSPDGQKLAYLALDVANGMLASRWFVWDGKTTTGYARFFPSMVFLQNYLAFFDQYAQSHRIWSPDSTAFVYAGIAPTRESGIWVQELGEGVAPRRVAAGVYATWSPQ
jgi:TolB protein